MTSELYFAISERENCYRKSGYDFQDYDLFAAADVSRSVDIFSETDLCSWRCDFSVLRTFRPREIPPRALR